MNGRPTFLIVSQPFLRIEMHIPHQVRWVGVVGIGVILLSDCREASITSAIARHFTPRESQIAVPSSDQHLFLFPQGVPIDFASRVTAQGGSVACEMVEIGVALTRDLSDDEANAIAGGGVAVRDFSANWIPEGQIGSPQAFIRADSSMSGVRRSPLSAALLSSQWNMAQIHAPEAWATSAAGTAVRVAILDSGLDPNHLDQRGVIDTVASISLVPSASGPPDWADDNMHGTLVGGVVTSNNIEIAGVAPNARLIAVKVLDAAGNGSLGNVIAGIYYATSVAQVINMSLGAYLPKNAPGASYLLSAMNRALTRAKSRGVIVVSAAGNQGTDLQHDHDFIELPCEAGPQLCVSATGADDAFASYSNYGQSAIDVAAPGGDGPPHPSRWIYGLCSSHSVDPAFAVCQDGAHYILEAGTSLSAPHVAGLAAYIYSEFGPLAASSVMNLIAGTADDLGQPGSDPYFGKGRINALNALGAGTR